ncbi:MAG: hypothetical protein MUC31_04700, partial [Bacteroidales bacterium]|nr:hypothetical protein [Bacteroidales bacterium]
DQGVDDDTIHDPTLPAGNSFSDIDPGSPHFYDIHNEQGGSINYYYHQIVPPGYRIEPTANVGDVYRDFNYGAEYTKGQAR